MSALLQQRDTLDALQRRVKQALYKMAFDIRLGTTDERTLYNAIFANTTRFSVGEAVLLTYHFSTGANDLRVLGAEATDEQLQVSVEASNRS
jgi:hypothetical protein